LIETRPRCRAAPGKASTKRFQYCSTEEQHAKKWDPACTGMTGGVAEFHEDNRPPAHFDVTKINIITSTTAVFRHLTPCYD
jgi:hypothetical protein